MAVGYREQTKNFTVTADGAVDVDGVWRIDVILRFREGISDADKSELVGAARVAAVMGIAQVGQEGRSHGATSVRVVADGDPAVFGHLKHLEI